MTRGLHGWNVARSSVLQHWHGRPFEIFNGITRSDWLQFDDMEQEKVDMWSSRRKFGINIDVNEKHRFLCRWLVPVILDLACWWQIHNGRLDRIFQVKSVPCAARRHSLTLFSKQHVRNSLSRHLQNLNFCFWSQKTRLVLLAGSITRVVETLFCTKPPETVPTGILLRSSRRRERVYTTI